MAEAAKAAEAAPGPAGGAHAPSADPRAAIKAKVRATVRRMRHDNFESWYSHLGAAAAVKLQEDQEAQLAPRKVHRPPTPEDTALTSEVSQLSAAIKAAEAEEDAQREAAAARRKAEEDAMFGDKAARRAKIPAKDLRARAIVQVARLQRYLEDLPPRQVVPPRCRAVGLPRGCTKGDVNGEIGRLEVSLKEGLVTEENTAAVLLQIGRLRDFVDDRPLSRKRLRRLINKEVALPWMFQEAHRIIAASLLRSGLDTDVEACEEIQHHVEKWLELTPDDHRRATLMTAVAWIRDRLHLDKYRIALLEQWAAMEMQDDEARLAEGVIQEPNARVFLELAFHAIRQEEYEHALRWVSDIIQLAPSSLSALDATMGVSRGAAASMSTKGTPFDPFHYQSFDEAAADEDDADSDIIRAAAASGTARRKKHSKKQKSRRAAMSDDKRAAIRRAVMAARESPGPGAYRIPDGIGRQPRSDKRTAPASTFGAKLARPADNAVPGPGAYEPLDTVGYEVPTSHIRTAPAVSFQSRTLFGSVYNDQVRKHVGMPAPTSYVVDDYSHARARWRATAEAKRVMPFIKPVLRESQAAATNPGVLEHVDYSVHPKFAGDVTQPTKRIAPAPVGARPRPVLEASDSFTDKDALLGKYSGYSTATSVRPGAAEERARILSGALPARVPGLATLGGAPVFTRPVSPSRTVGFSSTLSSLPGEGDGGDGGDSGDGDSDSDGPALPVYDPSRSPSKQAQARSKLRSSGRERSTLPADGVAGGSSVSTDGSRPASPPKPKRSFDFKTSTLDSAAAAAESAADNVKLPKSATITGHIPAPFFGRGGVIPRAGRWDEYTARLELAAMMPGPRYMLPALPSGPAYTAQGGFVKDDTVDSAFDGNGAGPGQCREDSAFGAQVSSLQPSAPSGRFMPKSTPALNLRDLMGENEVHDKPSRASKGSRNTQLAVLPKGLPGVGSYDPTKYNTMAATVAKKAGQGVLEEARASYVKRKYN